MDLMRGDVVGSFEGRREGRRGRAVGEGCVSEWVERIVGMVICGGGVQ